MMLLKEESPQQREIRPPGSAAAPGLVRSAPWRGTATALGGQGILSDVSSSLRIAKWAYRQTYDADGLTWLKNDELLPLDEGWNASLDRLLRQ